jgi:hypothetical protein
MRSASAYHEGEKKWKICIQENMRTTLCLFRLFHPFRLFAIYSAAFNNLSIIR